MSGINLMIDLEKINIHLIYFTVGYENMWPEELRPSKVIGKKMTYLTQHTTVCTVIHIHLSQNDTVNPRASPVGQS